jgi:hypothetical protein
MDITTMKLNLIQELLKVDDLSVLKEVENILAKSKHVRKGFKDITNPMSLAEASEFERIINEGGK